MEDVLRIGERIRRAIAETSVVEGEQRVAVTVSVGGATYRDTVDSPDALISAVDAALYETKQSGPDRLAIA